MHPIHSATLSGIEAIARRHYLRPVTLEPTPGDPGHWSVRIPGRTEPVRTEVVCIEGRYTFQDAPVRPAPNWDRVIENETIN